MTSSQAQINEILMQGTCAVLQGGQVRGAAWLLDNDGHLLTAGHLLGKANPVNEVEVRFPEEDTPRTARKVHWDYQHDRGIDWAILELTPPLPNRTALPICLARNAQGQFQLYGYGRTLVDLSPGMGTFVGPYHPQNKAVNRLFSLETLQTREGGYSGAAIFSRNLEGVVAIQVEGTTVPGGAPHGTTVLAMPLYRIAQGCVEKGSPEVRILSDALALKNASNEAYWYHVYLSYDRGGIQERWVQQFFLDELTQWLKLELNDVDPQVFSDYNVQRSVWDANFMEVIRRSCCLVAVLTPGYWRSPECLAEMESFRCRQVTENLALTYGVLFHEGGRKPEGPKYVHDFHEHANFYEGFRASASYGRFQDEVKGFAKQLAGLILNAPRECETSWPVINPSTITPQAKAIPVRIERPRF